MASIVQEYCPFLVPGPSLDSVLTLTTENSTNIKPPYISSIVSNLESVFSGLRSLDYSTFSTPARAQAIITNYISTAKFLMTCNSNLDSLPAARSFNALVSIREYYKDGLPANFFNRLRIDDVNTLVSECFLSTTTLSINKLANDLGILLQFDADFLNNSFGSNGF